MSTSTAIPIRRDVRPEDRSAILALHERVYIPEYGMGAGFVEGVRRTLAVAGERGWPTGAGAGWLVDRDGRLDGSLGLTDEGGGIGTVRWVVLAPELRGRGLGRRMLGELMAWARASDLERLQLDTFSELTAAGHLYREHGFRLTAERTRGDWGRPIVYQHYELVL